MLSLLFPLHQEKWQNELKRQKAHTLVAPYNVVEIHSSLGYMSYQKDFPEDQADIEEYLKKKLLKIFTEE